MERSETIKNISSALLTVQKSLGAVSKSADNPYFSSKYADLNTIISASKGLLNDSGIVTLQPVGRDVSGHFVETIFLHSSGEWLSSKMYLTENANADMQKLGAAVTYARRYGLQSLLFMEAEDDDGETAVGRGRTSNAKSYTKKASNTSESVATAVVTPVTPSAPRSSGFASTKTTTTSVSPSTGTQTVVEKTETVQATPARSTFKRPSATNGNGKGVF